MPLTSIAIFIVTVGFALVCIYIAKLLHRITGLMGSLVHTADEVERQLDLTVAETELLILEAERTATDAEEKLQATNGVFSSLQKAGQATSMMSELLKDRTKNFEQEQDLPGVKPFIRSIQWAEYANVLFEAWQRGKKVAGGAAEQQKRREG